MKARGCNDETNSDSQISARSKSPPTRNCYIAPGVTQPGNSTLHTQHSKLLFPLALSTLVSFVQLGCPDWQNQGATDFRKLVGVEFTNTWLTTEQ